MKKISKLLNQLIELNSVIKQIENRSTFTEITSSDLDTFYEFSILKITDIEKAVTDSLLANTINKHNIILDNINEKFIIFNNFQNKYQQILEKTNLRKVIEDKLSFISHQIENTKNELAPIDKKLYDIKSTISASEYSNPQSITDKLVEEETILKNKSEPIRKKYKELQNQKREQENLAIQKYSQVNFKKIAIIFNTSMSLIRKESVTEKINNKNYPKESVSEKINDENCYIDQIITLSIHKAFKDTLYETFSSNNLHSLLNLSNKDFQYKIPKNYRTKTYFLIKQLENHIKKSNKNNIWRDSILKKLNIDLKVYQSNNGKTAMTNNPEDKEFVKIIKSILKEH